MKKVLHIITRLDKGGSAQNTLLTCLKLSRKYEMMLISGISQESNMTDSERDLVERQKGKGPVPANVDESSRC